IARVLDGEGLVEPVHLPEGGTLGLAGLGRQEYEGGITRERDEQERHGRDAEERQRRLGQPADDVPSHGAARGALNSDDSRTIAREADERLRVHEYSGSAHRRDVVVDVSLAPASGPVLPGQVPPLGDGFVLIVDVEPERLVVSVAGEL